MGTHPFIRKADDVDPVPCPCGQARRIVTSADGAPFSVHRVSLSGDAELHYHEGLTECYVVLEGSGEMILESKRYPVEPGDVIYIPPRVPHALRGDMEIVNIVSPPFDPEDEHVIEEA
jgi:mannose-6-phosphate isomerase-like protein (cupin superfamily)